MKNIIKSKEEIANMIKGSLGQNKETKTTINLDDDEDDLNNIAKKQKIEDTVINKNEVTNNATDSSNNFLSNLSVNNAQTAINHNDENNQNKNQLLNEPISNKQNGSNSELLLNKITHNAEPSET
jgi:hypothetical protein